VNVQLPEVVGCLQREKRGDAIWPCPDTGQNRVIVVMQVTFAAPRPSRATNPVRAHAGLVGSTSQVPYASTFKTESSSCRIGKDV